MEADPTINADPPTKHEIAAAIQRSKTRKALGVCSISAEMLKQEVQHVSPGCHTSFVRPGTVVKHQTTEEKH